MSLSPVKTVRRKIAELLATITVANGFNTTVKAANIRNFYDQAHLDNTNSKNFPKLVVGSLGGSDTREPGMNRVGELNFVVVGVTRLENARNPEAAVEACEDLLEDVRRLIHNNDTLGGVVHDVSIQEFSQDGGALLPESAFILRLKTSGYEYDGV